MNTTTTRTFRLGLMIEEKDLPAIHDHFNTLEDDLNAIAQDEQIPMIYVTLDLRNYPAEDSLEVTKDRVILHLSLEGIALTNFRAEVIERLTKWLAGVENIPGGLIDRIMQLGDV
ncbi:MAG: hypothetical protein GVY26_00225 [Bacteroidetes bacterium]|jgi:hypothetical protein|nr:hypothetical protein [Bacteroidota bacterium]